MTFGGEIKRLRDEMGLTAADFGKAVGMTENAVHDVEAGMRSLTPVELRAVARVLEVTPSSLLKHGKAVPGSEMVAFMKAQPTIARSLSVAIRLIASGERSPRRLTTKLNEFINEGMDKYGGDPIKERWKHYNNPEK